MSMRIGHGYDIHKLVEGRELYIAGVKIPFKKGLLGHSDADVALHAACDSMLGAAGLFDIGFYFPPSDQTFKDISSLELLRRTNLLIKDEGWKVSNLDISIVAEAPKLSTYIATMKVGISEVLGIKVNQIGIKATTNEGIDQIGEGLAISAHAVCLLEALSST